MRESLDFGTPSDVPANANNWKMASTHWRWDHSGSTLSTPPYVCGDSCWHPGIHKWDPGGRKCEVNRDPAVERLSCQGRALPWSTPSLLYGPGACCSFPWTWQCSMSCVLCPWQRGGSPDSSFASTALTCGTSESASSYKTVPSWLCACYWWPTSKWSTRCWCSLQPRISLWWCYSSTAWWCWPWMSVLPWEVSQQARKEGTGAQENQLRLGSYLETGQGVLRRAWLFLYRPRR